MNKKDKTKEAKRIFRYIVNEALEEYVIVNGIKSAAEFDENGLRKLLYNFYSRMQNEKLRTKIYSTLEYIEQFIDYDKIDYDLCVKDFYYRKVRALLLYATEIMEPSGTNAVGDDLYFTPASAVFVDSLLPYFREWIKENCGKLIGNDRGGKLRKTFVKGFYNSVNYCGTKLYEPANIEVVLNELIGLIGFKYYRTTST